MRLDEIVALSPVIPVITIEDEHLAVPMARALADNGLRVLEVTLRTSAGMNAIRRIAAEVENAVVGVGTALSRADLHAATKAGAKFAVSPGLIDGLAASECPIPLLPGIATASELMRGISAGYRYFKFFPALPAGGIGALKAFAGPFPAIKFCPTGGISAENAAQFLSLPNVVCVGGSWVAPPEKIANRDWGFIAAAARAAMSLRKP
jgi:2-dehydro-3-deoxyphosphogluconate aldolase/(4S)-4-hydroxy-2-oxoglutarate aldolase